MRTLIAAVVVGAGMAGPVVAQDKDITLSVGPTLPTGAYGQYANTGWLATAGLRVGVGGKGAWVGGEVVYGRNSHSDFAGDKTTTPGVFGEAGYRFGAKGRVRPFVRGAVGLLNHQFGTNTGGETGGGDYGQSDWGLGVVAGGGVEIPAGRMAVRGEVRYIARKETTSIPLMVGLSIPLGGR